MCVWGGARTPGLAGRAGAGLDLIAQCIGKRYMCGCIWVSSESMRVWVWACMGMGMHVWVWVCMGMGMRAWVRVCMHGYGYACMGIYGYGYACMGMGIGMRAWVWVCPLGDRVFK